MRVVEKSGLEEWESEGEGEGESESWSGSGSGTAGVRVGESSESGMEVRGIQSCDGGENDITVVHRCWYIANDVNNE